MAEALPDDQSVSVEGRQLLTSNDSDVKLTEDLSQISSSSKGWLQCHLTEFFETLQSDLQILEVPYDSAYTSSTSICPTSPTEESCHLTSSFCGAEASFKDFHQQMAVFNNEVQDWEMNPNLSHCWWERNYSSGSLPLDSDLNKEEMGIPDESGESSHLVMSCQDVRDGTDEWQVEVDVIVNMDDVLPTGPVNMFLKRWKQLPRLQRVVLSMVAVGILVGLIYAVVSQSETSSTSSVQGEESHGDGSQPMVQLENNLTPPPIPANNHEQQDEGGSNVQNHEDDGKKEGADQIIPPPEMPVKRNERQEAVVSAMKHAWKGYKTYAWGHDHLKPITRTRDDWLHLGLTLIDALDTLWIMDLKEEFTEAQEWVTTQLNFNINQDVNLFETTIRVLGGLLSSYHLTKEQIFLDKAIDLGDRLVAAFDSGSGVPFADVNLYSRRASKPKWGPDSSTSEVTTIQLEFRDLSRITGNPIYENKAGFVTEHIHKLPKTDGLVPIFINAQTGQWRSHSTITLGARGDSYYEYLIKQWIQTGRTKDFLRDDFNESISGMEHHLAARTDPNNLLFFGELHGSTKNFINKMDELTCFLPGSLILGVHYGMPKHHKRIAEELMYTCTQTWLRQPTNLAPEITYYNTQPTSMNEDFFVKSNDAHYLLRPETIESLWYMYHLTGNKTYQDWGWQMFQGIEAYCKVENGYTSIGNVKSALSTKPKDKMESFFLGETLKYLYLLFMDDQSIYSVDKWVFNTEGHLLPIYSH